MSTIALEAAFCCTPANSQVAFHTSLNVSDLGRSIAFYRALFGIEPAKQRTDYAKFELAEPPLVLSLIPGRVALGGTLNHVGIRLGSSEELVKVQARLEAAGIRTQREEGVECCYSRQTKFGVTDPDRTLWELYVFHADIDEHGHDTVPDTGRPNAFAADVPAEKVVWQHNLADPVPDQIPHPEFGAHEVMFEGTFNRPAGSFDAAKLLAEAWRVLRPGGTVRIHGLSGDRPYTGELLALPGPAAAVKHVPTESDLAKALTNAGFVDVQFEKLSLKAYFHVAGVQMREVLISGRKPGHRPKKTTHAAVYLGPLAQVTDDYGNVFHRGEHVSLNIHDWQALSKGAAAAQFALFPPEEIA
jgi:catechol 2,3-dioxygenase-like lactoylglutathione lyase family enzyme